MKKKTYELIVGVTGGVATICCCNWNCIYCCERSLLSLH